MGEASGTDRFGAYVATLRDRHPVVASVDLAFADLGVRIESNSTELIGKLEEYYREFRGTVAGDPIVITALEGEPPGFEAESFVHRPLEPGKTRLKEEYADLDGGRIVRKVRTGMHFLMRGEDHVAIGPCCANDNQIVNFANNRHIQWLLHRGCLLTHAAAISRDGRGLAFAGFSGMGKSTLALHIMSRGPNLISNDRVMVRRAGNGALRIHGIAKHPRINPGTALNNEQLVRILSDEDRARFSAMPVEELWPLEHKYDALTDVCFGPDRFELEAGLEGFVILNWKRDGGPANLHPVDLRERRDLLRAIMKPTGVFYMPAPGMPTQDPDEDDYLAGLDGCPAYEISGGTDFETATAACLELLERR